MLHIHTTLRKRDRWKTPTDGSGVLFQRNKTTTSVTQENLDAIHTFLNDRPRKIIGFRTPFEYHRTLLAVF